MFTGIIQDIGRIGERQATREGTTFTISAPRVATRVAPGDSVAVNGVCQTVESVAGERVSFTAVGETLACTTLDELKEHDVVNLECAATPESALGGHMVQGHIDGVAVVTSFERQGNDRLLAIKLPNDIFGLVVRKGSIAIDGVSLTVVDMEPDNVITITIIPYTLGHTIMRNYEAGTKVNVEADIVGKYVMQYLARMGAGH